MMRVFTVVSLPSKRSSDKISIPKRSCNVLFIIQILMKCTTCFMFELTPVNGGHRQPPKQDNESYKKTNYDNIKLCNKNVNLVERNYISS